MWIPVASFNFSIKKNLKRIFVIYYHGKTSNAEFEAGLTRNYACFVLFPPKLWEGLVMVGLGCEISWPSRTMSFWTGKPWNLFKVLFTLSFLIFRAANATWKRLKSQQDILQLLVEFKLILTRDTATEPWQIWRRKQLAGQCIRSKPQTPQKIFTSNSSVLPRLDLHGDLETNWKNWLQT